MKDLRIIKELDKDPDVTISRLAKNVGVSQQVADYRMKNLLKKKIVTNILPLIDMGRLGYGLYRAHIRFRVISKQKKAEFEQHVFNNYKCFFIDSVGGRWDEYFDIFAQSTIEFQKKLSEITETFKGIIQECEVFTITQIHIFDYKYGLESTPRETSLMATAPNPEKLDQKDKKILNVIKNNARMPYAEIGKKIGLSRSTIKERIMKMHNRKIIAANRIFLNPSLMGKESYKLLLKLKNDQEQKNRLLQFSKQNKNIIYFLELMGKYDADLEIEIENREKLQELIIEIRNEFPFIEDYEIMPLFYDLGSDFYPAEKK
jgi:DNA-binding Lrp family transcriptional regulator